MSLVRRILLALVPLLVTAYARADYVGDYVSGSKVYCQQVEVIPYGGTLVSWAGSPAFQVRRSSDGTTSTTGVTYTADWCGTGCNLVTIDTSTAPSFYTTATDFGVVATSGTSGGIVVTSYGFCTFSVANRAVAPQTGDSYARLGSPSGATIDADILAVPAATWTYTTRSLTGSTLVTVVSPLVQNGNQTIVAGDDYSSSDSGRRISWSPIVTGGWPDLTSATVVISIKRGGVTTTYPGTVVTPTGAAVVSWPLTAAQTGLLTVGNQQYSLSVVATLNNSHVVTLVQGYLSVLAQLP